MLATRITPAPTPIARLLTSRVSVLAVEAPGRTTTYLYNIILQEGQQLRVEIGELPTKIARFSEPHGAK